MVQVRRKTVGDVDATRGHPHEFHAEGDLGLGFEMAPLRGLDELAFRVIGAFRSTLEQRQPGSRAADRTAEVDAIATTRTAAKNGLRCFADERD